MRNINYIYIDEESFLREIKINCESEYFNPNSTYKTNYSYLSYAAMKGFYQTTLFLLDLGAKPDHLNDLENTALIEATIHRNLSILHLLVLDYQANINQTNKYGISPLLLACLNNDLPTVRFLLNQQANINQITEAGTTVFDFIQTHEILQELENYTSHMEEKVFNSYKENRLRLLFN